jgi:hypothetical protein
VNEGAVRLEVAQATRPFSDLARDSFPKRTPPRPALRVDRRAAICLSLFQCGLRLARSRRTKFEPELTVSEVLAYHHGQNELAIEAEI